MNQAETIGMIILVDPHTGLTDPTAKNKFKNNSSLWEAMPMNHEENQYRHQQLLTMALLETTEEQTVMGNWAKMSEEEEDLVEKVRLIS